MNKYINICLLFSFMTISLNTFSQNGCLIPESNENNTSVYFSNGVWNTKVQAEDALSFLEAEYKNQLSAQQANSEYMFKTAYNYTQGYLTDVVQVFQQKLEESGVDTTFLTPRQIYTLIAARVGEERLNRYLLVVSSVHNASISQGVVIPNEEYLLSVEKLEEMLIESIQEAVPDALQVNAEHSGFYTGDLATGERVIVMAHSQGNLFALSSVDETLQRLPDSRGSISIIGVASPAATGSDSLTYYSYTTAHDDRVINALRDVEDVLASNIANDPGVLVDNRGIANHSFIGSYLHAGLASRLWADREINKLSKDLVFPTNIAGDGAIRASLIWGGEPDVDLHVFEPNGAHVFYINRTGQSGILDIDDTISFGPENYFVECENIEIGTYRIGVNYHSGLQPETAKIVLSLGDGSAPITREMVLDQAVGLSGNDNPFILFEVDVTEGDNGAVSYHVR